MLENDRKQNLKIKFEHQQQILGKDQYDSST